MDKEAVERVARAIWNLRREEEDRCDMELEDMGCEHPVWAEATVAIAECMAILGEPTEAMTKDGVEKALRVTISGDYKWPQYMADLWRTKLSASPLSQGGQADG